MVKVASAEFGHLCSVYDAMLQESELRVVEGVELHVWTGFLTKLIRDIPLPTPYFTKIRNLLLESGCAHQLQRGGNQTPSEWALVRAPTQDSYEEAKVKLKERETNTSGLGAGDQRVLDLQAQIDRLYDFTGCPRG